MLSHFYAILLLIFAMAERKGGKKGPRPGPHIPYQKDLWGGQGYQVFPYPTGSIPYPTPESRRKGSLNVTTPSLWETAAMLPPQPSSPILPGMESAQARPAYPEAEPNPTGTPIPSVANETPRLQ